MQSCKNGRAGPHRADKLDPEDPVCLSALTVDFVMAATDPAPRPPTPLPPRPRPVLPRAIVLFRPLSPQKVVCAKAVLDFTPNGRLFISKKIDYLVVSIMRRRKRCPPSNAQGCGRGCAAWVAWHCSDLPSNTFFSDLCVRGATGGGIVLHLRNWVRCCCTITMDVRQMCGPKSDRGGKLKCTCYTVA